MPAAKKRPPIEHAFGIMVSPKGGHDEEESSPDMGDEGDGEEGGGEYSDEAEDKAGDEAWEAIKTDDKAGFKEALGAYVKACLAKQQEAEGEEE